MPDVKPATLKDQLEILIARLAAKEAARPGALDGDDWWQLSEAEEEVFAIDRDRFSRLVMTHHCYEAFKHLSDSPEWDEALIEQARQDHSEWCGPTLSQEEFAGFAAVFDGLTGREAHATYTKQEFWTVRLGVMVYADERRSEIPPEKSEST